MLDPEPRLKASKPHVVVHLQVNLAQNLTAAFWKYSGMADGEDGDEDADDMGECFFPVSLSFSFCTRAP